MKEQMDEYVDQIVQNFEQTYADNYNPLIVDPKEVRFIRHDILFDDLPIFENELKVALDHRGYIFSKLSTISTVMIAKYPNICSKCDNPCNYQELVKACVCDKVYCVICFRGLFRPTYTSKKIGNSEFMEMNECLCNVCKNTYDIKCELGKVVKHHQ